MCGLIHGSRTCVCIHTTGWVARGQGGVKAKSIIDLVLVKKAVLH